MKSSIIDDIKGFYRSSDIVIRLIVINISVFVFINLIKLPFFLSNTAFPFNLLKWFGVPADLFELLLKPWTLITYMFTHEGVFHILFNMLMLYWGGMIFKEYLGAKRLLSTYITGGIAGAVLFILAYNIFPVFYDVKSLTFTIGASASVLAVFIAIATYLPNYSISLILFGPVRLKFIAIAMVLLDLINMQKGNSGGHIAHLGGAMYGFLFAKNLQQGRNLGIYTEKILDWITKLFDKKPKVKIVYSNPEFKKEKNTNSGSLSAKERQKRMDEILDKISKSGYDSLSKEEKEILFDMSKKI